MIKLLISGFIPLAIFLLSTQFEDSHWLPFDPDQGVVQLVEELGGDPLPHPLNSSIPGVSAKAGEEIIKYGFTKNKKGRKVKKQSKHYVCTSCHNLEKEDPDLSVSDPEARLQYAIKNDLPFLQGTTLYGAVNRTSFYNDDYYKKYGDLVVEAKNDIRAAIQLCATECAQGRELEDWEIESILAYLYEIDLKVSDLKLNTIEVEYLEKAKNNENDKSKALELLESKYLKGSPATFINPPAKIKNLRFENPDLQEGKMIYEKSCLYCHNQGKYSYFQLDKSKMSFKHLSAKANGYGSHSIYQVVRFGVPSYVWKKSYMPHYTEEKLSRRQLENLRAYIDYKAKD